MKREGQRKRETQNQKQSSGLPPGPEWLLELQPSHSHLGLEERETVEGQKGTFPS